ncbi:MAG TPA: T9SS type A sorting domain-containing protein [Bacteroidia bacterium]|nr:T9SS type A sorting domain-containing protein [Bacteroidia bacterium]
MKKFYILFLLLPFQVFSQISLDWTDTLVVNRFTPNAFTRPKIALTKNNVPVVMWGRKPNQRVFVSRFDGAVFAQSSQITPANVNAFVEDWLGPDMAASGDTVFVVFKSHPEMDGFVYSVRSVNGGASFSDTVRVYPSKYSRFPAVAVAPGGKPFVTFMTFNSSMGGAQFAVATSNDGGISYQAEVEASTNAPGEVCDCCPGFIGAETNNFVYSLFRNNDNNLRDIWAVVSTNAGVSFTASSDIDNSNWMINGCPSTGPDAYVKGDSIVTVWMSGASGSSRIYIGTAHKNTLAVGLNAMLSPGVSSMANQNYPKVAGNGDTLGVVWQESQMGSTIIKFIYSVTGPAGLLNQVADTVSINFSGAQKNPDIAFANGTFYFVWQDDNKQAVTYLTATISGTTKVKETKLENHYSLYPNPVNDKLNIQFYNELKGEITLIDYAGKTVFTKKISSEIEIISTEEFSEGIYILSIETPSFTKREKIVVKR